MAQTGTITLTQNSAAVTGSGTAFTTALAAGGFIVATVGGTAYTIGIKSIESNTALTLNQAYNGPTTSGLVFDYVPMATLNLITSALAAQVTYALRAANLDRNNWQQIFTGTGNVTVNIPDGTSWTGPAWNSLTTALDSKATKGDNSDITSIAGLTTALSVAQGGTGGKTPADARTGLELGSGATPVFTGVGIRAAAPSYQFYFNNSSTITSRFVQYDASNVAMLGANFRAPKFVIGDVSVGYLDYVTDATMSHIRFGGAPVLFTNGIASYGTAKNNNTWNMLYNGTLNWFINGSNVGYVTVTTSDRNLKKDINYDIDYSDDLKKIMAIKPASFVWDDGREDKSTKRGFIAQDLYEIADDMALKPLDLWGVEMLPMLSRLIGAVKAQQGMIESRDAIIADLQERMNEIDGLDK